MGASAARPPVSAAEGNLVRTWIGFEPERFRGAARLNPPALSGELLGESGLPIGSIEREIDPALRTAYHRDFRLFPGNQGQGLSKDILRSNINFYRQQELNSAKLVADDIGGYTWSKYGFVPDPLSWSEVRRSLARRFATF